MIMAEGRPRDVAGWLLTPVSTLVLAPPLTMILSVALLAGGGPPALCERVTTANGCEELTLGVIGEHAVAFAVLWLALWVLPWWRSWRRARIVIALIASLVLLAIPVRMAATDDSAGGRSGAAGRSGLTNVHPG